MSDIDAVEIIDNLASAEHGPSPGFAKAHVPSRRRVNDTARFALRFLELLPDDATVIEVRESVMRAFPGVLSG